MDVMDGVLYCAVFAEEMYFIGKGVADFFCCIFCPMEDYQHSHILFSAAVQRF